MVKAIEVFEKEFPQVSPDYFKLDSRAGIWRFPTFSYSADARHPVVVYSHSSYRYDFNPEVYRRLLKYCTIFIVIEVGFSFIFDDIMYHPSKGDIVIIKNEDIFATYLKEKSFDNYYEIDFPLSFFEYVKEDSMFTELFYDKSNSTPNIISTSEAACDSIVQKLEQIKHCVHSDNKSKDYVSWSYIIQIMDIIYSQRDNNKSHLHAQNLPPKLKNAIEYINGNFINLQTIDEVANYCGITPTYLARMFKKILDTTPNEYVTNLRIAYARHLLNQGKSITDVCYESGFNNYTYFISKFKAITGTTPSKYQKNHL